MQQAIAGVAVRAQVEGEEIVVGGKRLAAHKHCL
jgi:hypothetical protein